MSLSLFHPAVQKWFSESLGTPTPAQTQGWSAIRQQKHTLIAAPTGSGKTLAAFLSALDDLFREGLETPLPDEVRVVYVSPLKALSTDIHKNLAEPRKGIRRIAEEMGLEPPRITAAVRTGDTTQAERAAMIKTPPHILVTTPESLYLLLTAERSREMLRTVRTVIVDEIHAVIGTRRGAHLALTLERLQQICTRPLLRLGLSATQKPIEEVARYLAPHHDCIIINEGHRRDMDLGLELPRSPLDAVMSHEVWEEIYDRLTELIEAHRTTLVFVNTRRMAERLARHLSDRLGEESVTAHHGSLSKENRLDAEERLKSGKLRALVATASLELGIDIGHVDLVCQIGSPHRIATFLQRVGRSGHTVSGTPKGRIFPVSLDDLVECAALLRSVRQGELDRILVQEMPLDVLAQHIVAESACDDYSEDELFALVKRARPYRDLPRETFDSVVTMVSEGFATRRGRRGALVHRDEVNRTLRGRRGARLLSITSGGAIPEVADYRVVLEGDETFIGTLNEDFAIESSAGDIFQLGNTSWQVVQVGTGVVRVADAKGAPPNIPFWLGEAPARSDELSRAVSELRRELDEMLSTSCGTDFLVCAPPKAAGAGGGEIQQETVAARRGDTQAGEPVPHGSHGGRAPHETAREWLMEETGLSEAAATEIVSYLTAARQALGGLPTQQKLILERFFDEAGGMQLILHAPFGSRINKAWGLALRKRFCRQFNFELQAAATEDAILLSLGPQHSFPLADVFRYLHPSTCRDVLVQAFLVAPVFQTRWRWNTTVALAVPRNRNGRKIPPQLQRSMADDLMAAVFPDAAACPENLPGDRELPDHPLVNQVVRDCLEEAMDFEGLSRVLSKIHGGELELIARDTPEPSPLCNEIINARPYAFLDDAPLEERRTQAVYSRRAGDSQNELGALDDGAIERVRDEERPDPRDADELHDILLTTGFLTADEASMLPHELFDTLVAARRAGRAILTGTSEQAIKKGTCEKPVPHRKSVWVAAERLPEIVAVHPAVTTATPLTAPATRAKTWSRESALVELVRGRLSITGPITTSALAASLAVSGRDAEGALLALESEGFVLRGVFTPSQRELEWCDRRLLARIHRYTLNRLRAEIEPVTSTDFMRFLFAWHHATPATALTGIDGLHAVLQKLDGFELAASAWEKSVLPLRVQNYDPSLLDMLCLNGEVSWMRLSLPDESDATRIVGATPIAIVLREHAAGWLALRGASESARTLTTGAQRILETIRNRGASFARELSSLCDLDEAETRSSIAELVAAGIVSSDGFAGLRMLTAPWQERPKAGGRSSVSGRWALIGSDESSGHDAALEMQARVLLARYGVVFRRLLTRETNAAPWRELARVYRRLEARGEIRGGRFVTGVSGEQFALADAVERLREERRTRGEGSVVVISAADPLNLTGILTADDRIRAVAGNRIAFRDGIAVSVMEGDYLRPLVEMESPIAIGVSAALAGRRVPVTSGYVGRAG